MKKKKKAKSEGLGLAYGKHVVAEGELYVYFVEFSNRDLELLADVTREFGAEVIPDAYDAFPPLTLLMLLRLTLLLTLLISSAPLMPLDRMTVCCPLPIDHPNTSSQDTVAVKSAEEQKQAAAQAAELDEEAKKVARAAEASAILLRKQFADYLKKKKDKAEQSKTEEVALFSVFS